MGKLAIINDEFYVWTGKDKGLNFSFIENEFNIKDKYAVNFIDGDTPVYVFTDSQGEKKWWWAVEDEAVDVFETNVSSFFSQQYGDSEYPVVVCRLE